MRFFMVICYVLVILRGWFSIVEMDIGGIRLKYDKAVALLRQSMGVYVTLREMHHGSAMLHFTKREKC